jgi:hypothetical protein
VTKVPWNDSIVQNYEEEPVSSFHPHRMNLLQV